MKLNQGPRSFRFVSASLHLGLGLSARPKVYVNSVLYCGWLMAATTGFMAEANLAKKAPTCEMAGLKEKKNFKN